MNTANLQLAGLYTVVAALVDAIREKGLLTAEEIDRALAHAEDASAADQARNVQLSDSNVDAICFPARYLRLANKASAEGRDLSFSQLATLVGETKPD